MFDAIIDVLDFLPQDGRKREQKGEALFWSRTLQTFDFILTLKLMLTILGMTKCLIKSIAKEGLRYRECC